MGQADIGLIGLAVMGQNLVLNMHDHGFKVAVFNRTLSKVTDFINGPAKGTDIIGTLTIEEFICKLAKPRKVMLMVKAGEAIDHFIELLLPHLEAGDVIIDGGNSLFTDTDRRCIELEKNGISYIGMGISGGEEGARHGPSIMPGGHSKAWPFVKNIFQSIAAKADTGEPCCDWVGKGGAGHYVKMVHNGIEYGDMQLICEAYQLMREGLGKTPEQLSDLFSQWNQGELESYLIEITSAILKHKDSDGAPIVDKILDVAGQKGTGKWTAINALNQGIPLTLIAEAVFARFLSALKEERVIASRSLVGPNKKIQADLSEEIHQALYASKIISYAQGFSLMRQASDEYGWHINFGNVAMMWREGCIIRSRFLGNIRDAYKKNPSLINLCLDPFFQKALENAQQGWRQVLVHAIELGTPMPCTSAALSYYDCLRSERLPANLLQAQRDYFGAHTYERIDSKRGEFYHTKWI